MLSRVVDNTFCYNLDNENMLREITVKVGLEITNTQEGVTVEALSDSRIIRLVMSSEFAKNKRRNKKKRKRGKRKKKKEQKKKKPKKEGTIEVKRVIEEWEIWDEEEEAVKSEKETK